MQQPAVYDVVIVGAGVAGLVAAVAAAKAGLSTVLLEKTALVGGAASWSFAAIWVPGSDQAKSADVRDDMLEAATYAKYIGGGENSPQRTNALLERGPGVLRFLAEAGVSIELMAGMGDILADKAPGAAKSGRLLEPTPISGAALGGRRTLLRTPPGDAWRLPISSLVKLSPAEAGTAIGAAVVKDQLAQGAGLVAQLMCAVRKTEVEIKTLIHVTRLAVTDARVSGVQLEDGTEIKARRAVLLTTGAYLSNDGLVRSLDALPDYRSMMPEGSNGDGFKLAAAVGAAVGSTRNNLGINVGYDNPEDPNGPLNSASIKELPRAHVIMVNSAGNRFGDESTFQEYAAALREYDPRRRSLRNLPCWMVFDTRYIEKWGFAGTPPGKAPDWLTSSSTIEALANKTGIDEAGLAATIARFNNFAASGVDEDFGRAPAWDRRSIAGDGKNAALGAIEISPFYAVKLRPTLQVGGSGIKADSEGRALDWSGAPISGLYAVGDVTLHDEFGTGYQAGISLASCFTFACIAIDRIRAT